MTCALFRALSFAALFVLFACGDGGAESVDSNEWASLERHSGNVVYAGADLAHQGGAARGRSWYHAEASSGMHISYGPYDYFDPGPYRASFKISYRPSIAISPTTPVVYLAADQVWGSRLVFGKIVTFGDFLADSELQEFSFDFDVLPAGQPLSPGAGSTADHWEFRALTQSPGAFEVASISIQRRDQTPTMDDLFAGRARFERVELPGTGRVETGGGDISHWPVALDGVWYIFSRDYFWEPVFGDPVYQARCYGEVTHPRIVVRQSIDQGQHWSDPVPIITPTGSSTECGIVDGAAFFDSETQQWNYITQCIGGTRRWKTCRFVGETGERVPSATTWKPAGIDSTGHREAIDTGDAVIFGRGEATTAFCAQAGNPSTICPSSDATSEEGTADYLGRRRGPDGQSYHYFTLHAVKYGTGYVPPEQSGRSWRLAVRTKDFSTFDFYDAGDSVLRHNPILGHTDAERAGLPFRRAAGIGGATTARVGSTYYTLAEMSDFTISPQLGQIWAPVLTRTSFSPSASRDSLWSFADSVAARQATIFLRSKPAGTPFEYARIFATETGTYVFVPGGDLHLYELRFTSPNFAYTPSAYLTANREYVEDVYERFLKRPASEGEIRFQEAELNRGYYDTSAPIDQRYTFLKAIFSSAEFSAAWAGESNASFAHAMKTIYTVGFVVGWDTQSIIDRWTKLLDDGQVTRAQAAVALVTYGAAVDAAYKQVLGRWPESPQTVDFRAQLFADGYYNLMSDLWVDLYGSPEGRLRYMTYNGVTCTGASAGCEDPAITDCELFFALNEDPFGGCYNVARAMKETSSSNESRETRLFRSTFRHNYDWFDNWLRDQSRIDVDHF